MKLLRSLKRAQTIARTRPVKETDNIGPLRILGNKRPTVDVTWQILERAVLRSPVAAALDCIAFKFSRAEARAEAVGEADRQKPLRAWFKKKRFILPVVSLTIFVILQEASGGTGDTPANAWVIPALCRWSSASTC